MLSDLKKARGEYERAFGLDDKAANVISQGLSDRDLELSGHVFVANAAGRRMQITVDDEATPSAFIKTTGIDQETSLLQVIVNLYDLRTTACKQLFEYWINANLPQEGIHDLIEELDL